MDGFLIEKILDVLPTEFSVIILFENRNTKITKNDFLNKHSRINNIFKLSSNKTSFKSAPRWFNSLVHWWKDDGYTVIEEVNGSLEIGDFIISIDKL